MNEEQEINPKVGRPTDYTKELADIICSKLSEGISLRTVCKADDMPDKSTVFMWLRTNKEFQDQYTQAKEASADAQHEELTILGDEAIRLSQSVDPKVSGAVVQAVKLKADNLKWSMSKMKPKKYGDRIDHTTLGEKLPTPILNVLPNNSHEENTSSI